MRDSRRRSSSRFSSIDPTQWRRRPSSPRSSSPPEETIPVTDPLCPIATGQQKRRLRRRSPVMLLILLVLWSVVLGLGLAQAIEPSVLPSSLSHRSESLSTPAIAQGLTEPAPESPNPAEAIGTVDVVPAQFQLGQELYLENCATCHVGLPPAVMPTDSWRDILTQSTHYGVEVQPLFEPAIRVVWNYVSTYSRSLQAEEPVPYRLRSSRYFKALHPKVDFPEPVTVSSCISCHPAAEQFNYRQLTPDWEDAP